LGVEPFWEWSRFGSGAVLGVEPFWEWSRFGSGAVLGVEPFWEWSRFWSGVISGLHTLILACTSAATRESVVYQPQTRFRQHE
jgi:hypothetical protein